MTLQNLPSTDLRLPCLPTVKHLSVRLEDNFDYLSEPFIGALLIRKLFPKLEMLSFAASESLYEANEEELKEHLFQYLQPLFAHCPSLRFIRVEARFRDNERIQNFATTFFKDQLPSNANLLDLPHLPRREFPEFIFKIAAIVIGISILLLPLFLEWQ